MCIPVPVLILDMHMASRIAILIGEMNTLFSLYHCSARTVGSNEGL